QLFELLRGVAREVLVVASEAEQVGVGLDRREVADMPVQRTGVTHAEARPRPAAGVVELADEIAARPTGGRVEPGRRGVPEAEALVVLRGGDDVPGTRADQFRDEGIGVEGR